MSRAFSVGDKWAYGPHGIGEVRAIEGLELLLWFSLRNATIRITKPNAARNMRQPLDEAGAAQLLEVLRAPSETMSCMSWVRRMRGFKDKLTNGLPSDLAELYRDLGRRPVISFAEKKVWENAKTLLVQELSLIWPDAEKRIKEAALCIR